MNYLKVVPVVQLMAMINILRQRYFPRSETTSRDKKSQAATQKGYACLMGEKDLSQVLYLKC